MVELEVKVSESTLNPQENKDINVATAISDYTTKSSANIGQHIELGKFLCILICLFIKYSDWLLKNWLMLVVMMFLVNTQCH